MTTFTTDDRKAAYDPGLTCVTPSSANGLEEPDLVAEAPYHPGYEDAIIPVPATIGNELKEWRTYKDRHIATSIKIIEFLKGDCKWDR